MTTGKKAAVIFLWIINTASAASGFISQIKIFLHKSSARIFTFGSNMSENEKIMLNLAVFTLLIFLINIILTYLITDIPYSPVEIAENFSPLLLIPAAVASILIIVNAVRTDSPREKAFFIAFALVYALMNAAEISCMLTVQLDSEE